MNFADQPQRKRKAVAKPLQTMLHRGDVSGNLDHVVDRNAGRFIDLE